MLQSVLSFWSTLLFDSSIYFRVEESSSSINHLSYLDCESCQFAKFHRLSLYPKVNKQASLPLS